MFRSALFITSLTLSLNCFSDLAHADILYVADSYTQSIRRFDLSTGADLGIFANTNSGLNSPMAMAFDAAGNLFVANKGRNNILKFTPEGVVSVFATNGVNAPNGTAFDSGGNLYVANDRFDVLKFSADGTGSVFANAVVGGQESLAFDSTGNLFVLTWNSGIRRITPNGTVSVLSAPMGMQGLAIDTKDNLYFGCENNIYRRAPNSTNSVVASSNHGYFNALAFDTAGNLWAAQPYRIARFTPDGVESELSSYPTVVSPTGLAIKKSSSGSSTADVVAYTINKTQHLWQNDAGLPVERPYSSPAGNHYAWHTRAQVFFSSRVNVVSAFVGPAGATPAEPLELSDDGLCLEYLNDQATEAGMDMSVPPGTYTIQMNTTHDGTKTVDLTLSGSVYPPAPHILNFTSLQSVNPATPLTISWDPLAGVGASDFILVGLIGPIGQQVFTSPLPGQTAALCGTNTSTVVPAGTLQPGVSYIGYVAASKVQNSYTTAYPGALGLSWYGRITEFLVKAGAPSSAKPSLRTSVSNGKLVLSWPASATGVVLQSSSSLGSGAAWQNLTSGISTVGSESVLTNVPTLGTGFFRLIKP